MAHSGQIIDNPVTGERIVFHLTAADTDGELLEFDMFLAPDGKVPGAHRHPHQTETFMVLEGTMEFRLGRRRIVAGPGETVTVPRGAVHRFKNGGDTEARVRVQVEPALKMEELLETTAQLAQEGKVLPTGMPRPVHLALFTREYAAEVEAPFPPPWVVRATMAPLAWFGRKRGHADRYEREAAPVATGAPAEAPARVPALV
jgi:quercetin dioxygenase-like cupin family protein